jgi:FkbM family methyltransferase
VQDRRIVLETGRQRLIRARHGYVLYNRHDTVIGRLIELYGEYFETEVAIFRRFMAPGDVALDVGANIGAHTLALAGLAGPAGAVYAFEPQRLVFQTLCANVALNSLSNVQCVNAAVGATARVLHLFDPDPEADNNFGGVELAMLAAPAGAPPTPQVVLDEYLALDRLKLVKIDVEGMEAEVLRGAAATLDRHKPVLYVENAYVDRSPELIGLLQGYGYQLYWHLPVYVTAGNYFGNAERPYPVAFVDRGGPHLDGVGFAINLFGVHHSLNVGIQGLRPVEGSGEHPYRRECVQHFAGPDIGVIRE